MDFFIILFVCFFLLVLSFHVLPPASRMTDCGRCFYSTAFSSKDRPRRNTPKDDGETYRTCQNNLIGMKLEQKHAWAVLLELSVRSRGEVPFSSV